ASAPISASTSRSMRAPRPMGISVARPKPMAASPGSGSTWSTSCAGRSEHKEPVWEIAWVCVARGRGDVRSEAAGDAGHRQGRATRQRPVLVQLDRDVVLWPRDSVARRSRCRGITSPKNTVAGPCYFSDRLLAMEWEDDGIVLATRRYGEGALVVQLLTRGHGRHAGLVRGGQGRKLRTVYQTGNHVSAVWKARLAEHLGTLSGELRHGHAARVLDDPARLACLSAAAALAEAAIPEREPHARAFEGLCALLQALDEDHGWAVGYVEWEMLLLAELGFGLDLSRCAATGEKADLVYVSPRSGQAVSAA